VSPPGLHEGPGPDRCWNAASAALLLVLVVLMGSTFRDYGVTADEGVQHRYGRRIARWYTTLGADRSATDTNNNLFLYGGAFELAAQAVERASPLGVYDTRHLVNVAFGLAGILAAWGQARFLGGAAAGFLSAFFLSLTPSYYGHCFANPKDIPFAALYALAAWAILRAADDRQRPVSPRIVVAGVAVGLAAGVRVNGLALVGFAGLLWGASGWTEGRGVLPSRREALRIGLTLAVLLAIAWVVMLACWPWAQLDPLGNPLRALGAFSDFQGNPVLFEGAGVPSSDLPRRYVPELFALTLPEFYLPALGLGALGAARFIRVRPCTETRRGPLLGALWTLSLAAFPLASTILGRTPLYNGVRHLLFVVPMLAILAGVSVAGALRSRMPALVRVPVMGAVVGWAILAGVDMVRLHPYQYVYFNRLFGGGLVSAVGRYETDYWFTSYKEGIEWVCRHYSRSVLHEPIRVGGNMLVPFSHYLEAGSCAPSFFTAVPPEEDPHVLLVATTDGRHRGVQGRLLHVVERLGAPLLLVYELKPPR
jgi:hypothetical protein